VARHGRRGGGAYARPLGVVVTVLQDIAPVIRSKNAGPTLLTLDILFEDEAGFRRGIAALTVAVVAKRYGASPDDISITPYHPAFALKITMPRRVLAGSPGDRDVYGAQQHVPLLEVPL